MPWTITIEQLRAERDDDSNRIGGTDLYEQLARGHRWLDSHDKVSDTLVSVDGGAEAGGRRPVMSFELWLSTQ